MADDKKSSFSNTTIETEVTVYEPKNGDFIKNISNSDDYEVLIVKGFAKGRNYKGFEWTRWYDIKLIGFAVKNFVDSVNPKDLLRVRGELDINDWLPKDASDDDTPNETEVLVTDPHKGGFWAHSPRWDTTTLNRSDNGGGGRGRSKDDDEDDEEEKPRRGRSSRRGRDDEGDDEEEKPRRSRGRARDDDEGEDDDAPRRGRSRRNEDDGDDEDDAPRRGRSRRTREDDDEDDAPRRGRSRRTRGDGDDD